MWIVSRYWPRIPFPVQQMETETNATLGLDELTRCNLNMHISIDNIDKMIATIVCIWHNIYAVPQNLEINSRIFCRNYQQPTWRTPISKFLLPTCIFLLPTSLAFYCNFTNAMKKCVITFEDIGQLLIILYFHWFVAYENSVWII